MANSLIGTSGLINSIRALRRYSPFRTFQVILRTTRCFRPRGPKCWPTSSQQGLSWLARQQEKRPNRESGPVFITPSTLKQACKSAAPSHRNLSTGPGLTDPNDAESIEKRWLTRATATLLPVSNRDGRSGGKRKEPRRLPLR